MTHFVLNGTIKLMTRSPVQQQHHPLNTLLIRCVLLPRIRIGLPTFAGSCGTAEPTKLAATGLAFPRFCCKLGLQHLCLYTSILQ